MLLGLVFACTAITLVAVLTPSASRLRFILQITALTKLAGFAIISFRSANVAQPVLGNIWIREFYGRIEAVENISARDVYRLRLATGPNAGLPPYVRVNLLPKQYKEAFQPGAVVRLCARLLPPAGPTLPGGYACKRLDIVVSDRWLPQTCRPRLTEADRNFLQRSGGLVFYLSDRSVLTANENARQMLWVQAAAAAR